MPRESKQTLAARMKAVLAILQQSYPDAYCELNHRSPLELLVATILSAQCTDKRVNLVTAELFKRYRSAGDYARAEQSELEQAIQSTGFFRNKAKSIRACCQALEARHGGNVPDTMEALVELGGVGRKTANVVLGNAFGKNCGIVVDTHVGRLSVRLGFTKQTQPEKVEQELLHFVPQEQWTVFSHWLIWHGRRRCFARNPDCARCEVLGLCPRVGVARRAAKKSEEG